jgi:hypothetical protein
MSEDIVERLREPPFGTETSERNIMNAAADEIERLRSENERLRTRVGALEKALNRYGKHDGLCGIVGGYGYCTCGFDDARAALVNAEAPNE